MEPQTAYRNHGLASVEISLSGTFVLTSNLRAAVLPLVMRLPLLPAAVQCNVLKGLKRGSLPSCYSDVMAMGPQCENPASAE